jgi:hypothetical protein
MMRVPGTSLPIGMPSIMGGGCRFVNIVGRTFLFASVGRSAVADRWEVGGGRQECLSSCGAGGEECLPSCGARGRVGQQFLVFPILRASAPPDTIEGGNGLVLRSAGAGGGCGECHSPGHGAFHAPYGSWRVMYAHVQYYAHCDGVVESKKWARQFWSAATDRRFLGER